jgi:preprotein translocase subunit SecG
METLITVLHVLAALSVCGLVLLQHGKGADMGAAFGGGASGSLFGATGSANFLSRTTAAVATVFFLTSFGLTWYSSQKSDNKGVMATHPESQQPAAPIPPTAVPERPAAPAPEQPAQAPDADSKVKGIPK